MTLKSDIVVALVAGVVLGASTISCSADRLIPTDPTAGKSGTGGSATTQGAGGGAGGAAGAGGTAATTGTGGAAGVGGVAGAGPPGSAGTGSAGIGPLPFEARVTAFDCDGTSSNTPAGPVVVDTTFTCAGSESEVGVAAGANDRGFVSLASYPPSRFVTIEATGSISAIQGPAGAQGATVLADATGATYLSADRLTGAGLGFYRLDTQGWWGEAVDRALSSTTLHPVGARFAADGRAYLAYYSYDDGTVTLSTRDTTGTWTPTQVPMGMPIFALTVDSQARPHVLFLTSSTASDTASGVDDWFPGTTPSVLLYPLENSRGFPAAAPIGDGRVSASTLTTSAIHVIVQQTGAGATDQTLPNTPSLVVTGCPPLPLGGSLPPTPCTKTGDGVVGQALAATADGLWLAYVSSHVDSDHVQSCMPFENATICMESTTANRSTAEVVLVRVPTDAAPTAPPAIVWRAPITGTPAANFIAMDGTSTRLVLAVETAVQPSGPTTVRYLTFDSGKL